MSRIPASTLALVCSALTGTALAQDPAIPRSLSRAGALEQITLKNLGYAGSILDGEQRSDVVAVVRVDEADNSLDLNGDGDTQDDVPLFHHLRTGESVILPVGLYGGCTPDFVVDRNHVVFAVDESGDGIDRNGNGEVNDKILHAYDAETGEIINLQVGFDSIGFVLHAFALEHGIVGSRLNEEHLQVDLNGSGTISGWVTGIHELDNGQSTILSGNSWGVPVVLNDFVVALKQSEWLLKVRDLAGDITQDLGSDPWESAVGDGQDVAFLVEEAGQDRNGDGDGIDLVLHVADVETANTRNVGVAAEFPHVADLNVYHNPSNLILRDGRVIVAVPEAEQGNADRNGDGDTLDLVAHVYDLRTDDLFNLGLAVAATMQSFETVIPSRIVLEDTLVLVVREGKQGGQDLNGDGDSIDPVLFLYDLCSRQVRNLGLAIDPDSPVPAVGTASYVAFDVDEGRQGADLNGDGDMDDCVVHVYDLAAQVTTNTALAQDTPENFAEHGLLARQDAVWFGVSELRQGQTDLNGDGDTDDFVLHGYEVGTATARNLERAISFTPHAAGDDFLVMVLEQGEQADLNGDGDQLDRVPHLSVRAPAGTPGTPAPGTRDRQATAPE